MRGRKPTPSHLKLIAGNPGGRPLNDREPKPAGALRDPPPHLTGSQREGWRYAVENAPAGLLKRLDRSVLVAWVVAEDLHRKASGEIEKFGAVIAAPKTDMPMQSPWVAILNRQAAVMLKAASELGFSPSSRSRVRVDGDQEETADPARKYLA